jgi:hypothetical protein
MEIEQLTYAKESQQMTIFRGMPIIARIGNKELDICNNETLVIQGLDLREICAGNSEPHSDDQEAVPFRVLHHHP